MKVLTGHLTDRDKRIIKSMFERNIDKVSNAGKEYYIITKDDYIYTVKHMKQDRGLIPCPGSPLRLSTYTSTFTL